MRAVRPPGTLDGAAPDPVQGEGDVVVAPRMVALRPIDLVVASDQPNAAHVMGGQCVGVIEHIGADPARPSPFKRGARVVVSDTIACGACDLCTGGLSAHCATREVLGVTRDGTWCDRVCVPARALVVVPDNVGDDQACLASVAGAAIHAGRMVHVQARGYVSVIGDSPLALLCAQVMTGRNASVRLLAEHDERLELCEKWGVRRRRISEVGRRHDQGVVIVAHPTPATLDLALGLVRPRGEVVLAGLVGSDEAGRFDLASVVENEVQVLGSRSAAISEALDLMSRGAIETTGLITRRFPLERAGDAISAATRGDGLQVVIEV